MTRPVPPAPAPGRLAPRPAPPSHRLPVAPLGERALPPGGDGGPSRRVRPAGASEPEVGAYLPVEDLWVVTTYYNPASYATRRRNFEVFRRAMSRGGVNWLAVECSFGDAAFDLEPSPNVFQVRVGDVMWQKERLLNVAIAGLPPRCTKVAWLDCDVLFENPEWAVQASRLLDSHPVVQPFEWSVRLPAGMTHYAGLGEITRGFCAAYRAHPEALVRGDFNLHGHTGFAWAARRDFLARHGLYDACIGGSADHMMAHAFCGDLGSPCVVRMTGENTKLFEHFAAWGRRDYAEVRGRVNFAPGTLLHLWHGDPVNRKYYERHQELVGHGFDPGTDLRVGADGAWEWQTDNAELRCWARDYFVSRMEDGEPDAPAPAPLPPRAAGAGAAAPKAGGPFANPVIADIYQSRRVADAEGNPVYPFPAAVPPELGEALYGLVRREGLTRTLEVGMAYGLFALFFCQAHRDSGQGLHTAIDPFQSTRWRSIGLLNVMRAGLETTLRFLETLSEEAMSGLITLREQMDFVLIDGQHTFDHALVDFFLADKLLRTGGLVAFHDAGLPSVRKVLAFVLNNRTYELTAFGLDEARIPRLARVLKGGESGPAAETGLRYLLDGTAVLKKTANDARGSLHYCDF